MNFKRKENTMNRIKSYYVTNRPPALRELIIYFGVVFLIMYGLGAFGMVFREDIERIFGSVSNRNLFVMILIYSPTLTGLILTVLYEGWGGLVALFKRGVFSAIVFSLSALILNFILYRSLLIP